MVSTPRDSGNLPQCDGDQYVTLYCGNCGNTFTHPISCGLRTCPNCRRRQYFRLREKYLPKVLQVDIEKLALVTLTLKLREGVTLRSLLDRIRKAFSDLRRRLPWEKTVAGGFYAIEAKWSEKYQAWNCHIHALVESRGVVKPFKATCSRCSGEGCRKCDGEGWYWQGDILGSGVKLTPQGLDAIWKQVTGDSYITNIMPVLEERGGKKGAVSYLIKYLLKGAEVGGRAGEYNDAYYSRRIVHSFGSWHSRSKDYRFIDEPEKEPLECRECGAIVWISEYELRELKNRAIEQGRAPPPEPPEPEAPPAPFQQVAIV